MRILVPLLVACALVGCSKKGPAPSHPESGKVPQPVHEDVDPRVEPGARGSERPIDEAAGSGDVPPVSACEAYAACCYAYVAALAQLGDVPEASLEAAEEGCKAIEQLEALGDAQESCIMALEALKQGLEAIKNMPGFVPPAACD